MHRTSRPSRTRRPGVPRTPGALGRGSLALALAMGLGFLGLAPSSGEAQEVDAFPRAPSLALAVGSSSTVGVWFPVGERAQLGTEVGLSVSRVDPGGGQSRNSWGANLGLPLRLPLAGSGDGFVPYLVAGPRLLLVRGDLATESTGVGGFAGVGLDWFPVSRVSVGGHVGLDLLRRSTELATDPFGNPTTGGNRVSWDLSTRSSGVRVHLYLP